MDLTGTDLYLLLVCVVGVGGALLGLLGLVARSERGGTFRSWFTLLAALALAVWTAFLGWSGQPLVRWLPLLVLAGVALLLLAVRSRWISHLGGSLLGVFRRPRVASAVLLVGCVAVLLRLALFVDQEVVQAPEALFPEEVWSLAFEEPSNVLALSDRGTPLHLKQAPPGSRPTPSMLETEAQMLRLKSSHLDRVIRVAAPDWSHNCHGWVFTAGRYWLAPAAVECILRENGYRSVEEPRAGDLIIYRKDSGGITHTGLVRAGGDIVLVESKWGWLGRYLHQPEEQCYGTEWSYYRSDRPGGHLVRGLDPISSEDARLPYTGKIHPRDRVRLPAR
jgi:hypothetical protein